MEIEPVEKQRDEIIEQLHVLNALVRKQNSVRHIFMTGVIYGLGAFLGSAIIATILFGIFAPYLAHFDWVRSAFERGSTSVH